MWRHCDARHCDARHCDAPLKTGTTGLSRVGIEQSTRKLTVCPYYWGRWRTVHKRDVIISVDARHLVCITAAWLSQKTDVAHGVCTVCLCARCVGVRGVSVCASACSVDGREKAQSWLAR